MNPALTDLAFGPVRGHFHMKHWRNGLLVDVEDCPNIIVNGAKEVQARLIGGDVTNRSITKIGVGIGSGAAAAGNTSLTTPFVRALTGVTYPSAGQVQFAFTIAGSEANGLAIIEFGLFTAGDVLFARRVRAGALNKESDLTLTGTWTITY